jgi:acetyl esterase
LDCADLDEMPPALVVAAECDPIAPQSHRYAAALQTAGDSAELHEFPGMIHGFAQFPTRFKAARDALSIAAAALRSALHPPTGASGVTVH